VKGLQAQTKLAALLVCHNRREKTLHAIRSLHAQDDHPFALSVFLFDDASTDGTAEAVEKEFPDTTIVNGDGSAFWNGGLYKVWKSAVSSCPDAYLWLNDDVELHKNALYCIGDAWHDVETRQRNRRFILAAATGCPDGKGIYGGKQQVESRTSFKLTPVPPSDDLQPIDTFNGNIVLVPREVSVEIGLNDPAFFHNFGDIDYGLRATAAGIACFLIPGIQGDCPYNDVKANRGYGAPGLSLREQWQKVNTHHGLHFRSWYRLTKRHSGVWWPLHFLLPYRWLIIPRKNWSNK
tara:strand:- start:5322 stop:6200 length:879 start_codon:yes stop_codon:yes gene_type:complete